MHNSAARWRRRNIALLLLLLLLLVRMRAHVVIVFGCWDDWGVWEDSSSIYLYSLSVHHARIVQQRGCQLLTGWLYRPRSAGVGGSSTATLCGGEQASRQQRAAVLRLLLLLWLW